jgi:RimJ/RimL family protein N-acetyltransferase
MTMPNSKIAPQITSAVSMAATETTGHAADAGLDGPVLGCTTRKGLDRPNGLAQTRPTTRRLTEADRAEVTTFLLTLDHTSRYCRFCEIMTDAAIVRYARAIDFATTVIVAAEQNGILVGMVEIFRYAAVPSTGEIALCVSPRAQSQGIGCSLLHHAVCAASDHSFTRLVVTYSAANARMQALIARLRRERHVTQGNEDDQGDRNHATTKGAAVSVEMALVADILPAQFSDVLEYTAVIQLV